MGGRTGSWGKSWQGPTDAQQDHEPPWEGKWAMSVVRHSSSSIISPGSHPGPTWGGAVSGARTGLEQATALTGRTPFECFIET